jgi:glycosyltransferase involved in cell wall biosynthesis
VRVLRVLPAVRSSDFERSRQSAGRSVIFASRYVDLDESSIWPTARQVPLPLAWCWAFRRRWQVVELPEPLWLRALPLTVSVGLAVRLSDLVLRRRTRIVTYAMENNEPRLLMGRIPRRMHSVVFGVIRLVSQHIYDRIAFASMAAKRCYMSARVLPVQCTSAIFEDLPEPCTCYHGQPKAQQITFIGALEARKGLPDLLAAWRETGLGAAGWKLAIAGSGPLAQDVILASAADSTILSLGQIGRREVHEVMAGTAVVVLPSRREGRWREQIGMSIVEGLAHGCHVVATPDTGLSGWLRRHGHSVLPEDFTVADLGATLTRAADNPLSPAMVQKSLPPVWGRIAAEDWMYH